MQTFCRPEGNSIDDQAVTYEQEAWIALVAPTERGHGPLGDGRLAPHGVLAVTEVVRVGADH